jgi:signal transduction histidine kinase
MSDPRNSKGATTGENLVAVSAGKEAKILAVDDDKALRRLVVPVLRDAGYQVIEAATGAEALALVSKAPDLIMLDVDLPDIPSFEVCKQFKANPHTAHIPVLHLSSTSTDPDVRMRALSSGADACLTEPIDQGVLMATVSMLLRLKNAEALARQNAVVAEHARQELMLLNETLEGHVAERTAELKIANDSLRDLSVRLLRMQDEERRRISRELHDSAGQLLAAIKMNNASIAREVAKAAPRAAQTLAESDSLVDEIVSSIRTISHLLHPPLLDEAGLPSALQWYVEEFSKRSGISVVLNCEKSVGRLPAEMETAVFRIVQECLGNVHRHSASPAAAVRVQVKDGKAYVEVSDEGRGIPADRLRELALGVRGGVGLRGMRERIAQFGGELRLESPGKGTIVRVILPADLARSAGAADAG